MPQIRLLPRHKEMLTTLYDALKQGTATADWFASRTFGVDGLHIGYYGKGVEDSPKRLPGWSDVNELDLSKFVQLGLFKPNPPYDHGFPSRYFLQQEEIDYLVQNNFEESSPPPSSVVNINSPNSIINVQSELNNSSQIIHHSSGLQEADKQTFEQLIDKLGSALSTVPSEYEEDKETIALSVKHLSEVVSSPKPNKGDLQISAAGLKKAAAKIASIASPVMTAVEAILAFISQIHR